MQNPGLGDDEAGRAELFSQPELLDMSHTAPARASNEWVVESGKATVLWGAGMFVAALCSKLFGLHPAVATLVQRTGDFLTALILVGPQVNAAVLRSQSALGVLCGLVTGLLTTGASTFYNRALVRLADLRACVPACSLPRLSCRRLSAHGSPAFGFVFVRYHLYVQVAGGDPGAVTALTSLYPAITILLSVLCRFESISVMKLSGVAFTALAGVCFARS